MHIVWLVRLVAAAVRVRHVHHLFDHSSVENHTTAACLVVVAIRTIRHPEAVPLSDCNEVTIIIVIVVVSVTVEQVNHLINAENRVIISNDKPFPERIDTVKQGWTN